MLRAGVPAKIQKAARRIGHMPTGAVLPESELRARVLQYIEDGRLPVVLSTTMYAGYGRGVQCDLCDRSPIRAS